MPHVDKVDSREQLADLTAHKEHLSSNFIELMKSARETPLAPAINAIAVEPINAGINVLNAASKGTTKLVNGFLGSQIHAPEFTEVQPIAIGKAKEGSANYYSQKFFAGTGLMFAALASGTLVGKVAHRAAEVHTLVEGTKAIHSSKAVGVFARETNLLGHEASAINTSLKQMPSTSFENLSKHALSQDSTVSASLTDSQKSLIKSFMDAHELANLDGVGVLERVVFKRPTFLTGGCMDGARVTSVTTYENAVKVYENPTGIKMKGDPDRFSNSVRITSDHDTFIKKEWGGKVSLLDGVGSGATIESVIELPNRAAAYINREGLFGPNSERVLMQDDKARVRLFDKADEPGAQKGRDGVEGIEVHLKKIADKFSGHRLNDRIESLLAHVPPSDRTIAEAIIKSSESSISGFELMKHLRAVTREAKEWWHIKAAHDSISAGITHPAADNSAGAFSYLMGKSRDGISSGTDVLSLYERKGEKRQALLLTGDASKYSKQEIAKLKILRASGVQMAIIDNSFERGINAIDLAKGTANEKLNSLIGEVRLKKVSTGMSDDEAVASILKAPGRKLAASLDADLMAQSVPIGKPRSELIDRMQRDLSKKYPFADDRNAAAKAIADIQIYDLPDVLDGLRTLHRKIENAHHSDVLYIVHKTKSQDLINHLYKEVNGLKNSQFVTMLEFEKLTAQQIEGKTLVLLDDAAYTGLQMSEHAQALRSMTNDRNQVLVANLATYEKALECISHDDGIQLLTVENVTPLYDGYLNFTQAQSRSHGIRGVTIVDSKLAALKADAVESKRLTSFLKFNRGRTWGDFDNKIVFFYKPADSTPKFIENFLGQHFEIAQ